MKKETRMKRLAEVKKEIKKSLDKIYELEERAEEESISYEELSNKLHQIGKHITAVEWYICATPTTEEQNEDKI